MKITQSSVQMQAATSLVRQTTVSESLRMWNDGETLSPSENTPVLADLSKEGAQLAESAKTGAIQETDEEDASLLTDKDRLKIRLLEDFVFTLTGKRIRFSIPDMVSKKSVQALQMNEAAHGEGPRRLGWGIDYQRSSSTSEVQSMSFSSTGQVQTADGRSISFSTDLTMSSSFVSQTHLSIKAGDALVDPLVLNLSGAAQVLGDKRISFDIDTDGTDEQIAFAAQGSGFLALDRNGNDQIDDGSELFGPQSGNGFSELAAFDGDDNGWIDENDAVFDRLRIWSMDDKGDLQLTAIGKAGVGAIYLGNVATPFSLRSSDTSESGQIARTGVYLKENGQASTIMHVDLSV